MCGTLRDAGHTQGAARFIDQDLAEGCAGGQRHQRMWVLTNAELGDPFVSLRIGFDQLDGSRLAQADEVPVDQQQR